jgi:ADP-dependent NAD(P)H-hydrate dehydratase / NAD(P)H-hydrate epimerase
MRTAHSVAAVRAAEGALMAKLPDGTLMQRAATGLAATCATLLSQVYGSRVVVLAGSGDNGGDALYAGARLAGRGAVVVAIAAGQKLHAAGAAELVARGGRVVPATREQAGPGASGHSQADMEPTDPEWAITIAARSAPGPATTASTAATASTVVTAGSAGTASAAGSAGTASAASAASTAVTGAAVAAIAAADLIIDGLTGIGGHGGLREPADTLARLAAEARADGALVVAVDLPSGIDADTGEVHGQAIGADLTVTFGTIKPGLLIDPGAERAGPAELIDIGLGPYLGDPDVVALQAADVAAILPRPTAESDKYRRGVLGLLAGSEEYTGAAVLSTGGAIRGGAGMVRLVSALPAVDVVRQHWPEAVITTYDPDRAAQAVGRAGRVQAWAAGPGIGTDEKARELLAAVLASEVPVLVDADGITVLAANRDLLPRSAPTLVTPHAGELARLISADRADIEARRLHYVRKAAAELGITVLLKGSTTVIASPDQDQPVLVNPTGSSWLATAGSGDVLSGLAGSLLAQGLGAPEAAAVAAFLHGLAARLAARDAPIAASDVVAAIPAAIRAVTGGDH